MWAFGDHIKLYSDDKRYGRDKALTKGIFNRIRKNNYIFPVYAYEHSGIIFSLTNAYYPFDCKFDGRYFGFFIIHKSYAKRYNRDGMKLILNNCLKEFEYGFNDEDYIELDEVFMYGL